MDDKSIDGFENNPTREISKLVLYDSLLFNLVSILIRRPSFSTGFFVLFYIIYFRTLFCLILFGMKGYDSDLSTYGLHYTTLYILCTSATRG